MIASKIKTLCHCEEPIGRRSNLLIDLEIAMPPENGGSQMTR